MKLINKIKIISLSIMIGAHLRAVKCAELDKELGKCLHPFSAPSNEQEKMKNLLSKFLANQKTEECSDLREMYNEQILAKHEKNVREYVQTQVKFMMHDFCKVGIEQKIEDTLKHCGEISAELKEELSSIILTEHEKNIREHLVECCSIIGNITDIDPDQKLQKMQDALRNYEKPSSKLIEECMAIISSVHEENIKKYLTKEFELIGKFSTVFEPSYTINTMKNTLNKCGNISDELRALYNRMILSKHENNVRRYFAKSFENIALDKSITVIDKIKRLNRSLGKCGPLSIRLFLEILQTIRAIDFLHPSARSDLILHALTLCDDLSEDKKRLCEIYIKSNACTELLKALLPE